MNYTKYMLLIACSLMMHVHAAKKEMELESISKDKIFIWLNKSKNRTTHIPEQKLNRITMEFTLNLTVSSLQKKIEKFIYITIDMDKIDIFLICAAFSSVYLLMPMIRQFFFTHQYRA